MGTVERSEVAGDLQEKTENVKKQKLTFTLDETVYGKKQAGELISALTEKPPCPIVLTLTSPDLKPEDIEYFNKRMGVQKDPVALYYFTVQRRKRLDDGKSMKDMPEAQHYAWKFDRRNNEKHLFETTILNTIEAINLTNRNSITLVVESAISPTADSQQI